MLIGIMVFLLGSNKSLRNPPLTVTSSRESDITPDFMTAPNRLILVTDGGLPLARRLELRNGGSKFVVTSLNQLAEVVKLQTPRMALQYVRILSTGTLQFSMPNHWVEIVGRPEILAVDGSMEYRGRPNREGYWGVVSSPTALKYVAMYPQISDNAGRFTIRRLLLVNDGKSFRAVAKLSTEVVSQRGGYFIHLDGLREGSALDKIHWLWPIRE